MIVPVILLLLSAGGMEVSVLLWGPLMTLPLLLSGFSAFAAPLLLLGAIMRPHRDYIVLDGSNVLFWRENKSSLDVVSRVIERVKDQGLTPVIWCDANVGYRIVDRYLGPDALARLLGVPRRQVFVALKGVPADPLLLKGACRLNVRVVTNDRFRDWKADHPKVAEPGFLVPRRVRNGQLAGDFGT